MSEQNQGEWVRIVVGFDLTVEEKAIVHRTASEMFEALAPISGKAYGAPLSGGPIPPEYLAYIGAISSAAGTAKIIADAIIAWRRKLAKNNISTNIRLEHPNKKPIDLTIATDDEITIYITDSKESGHER